MPVTEKQQEAYDVMQRCSSVKEAADIIGIDPKAVRQRLDGYYRNTGETKPEPKEANPSSTFKIGRSLTEFRNTYDKDTIIPQKIDEAIRQLGPGAWAYESEFVKLAGVSYMDLNSYRDAYADYIVYIKRDSKRVWAGSAELARKMKEML